MHTILIADDDARMRQMLRQIVAGVASAVFEASDGGEAMAVCATERPDWVLMDLRMKPMDGFRATVAIRARFPETRVVIVTQYDDAELRAEARRAGACAYVLKENLHELPGILMAGVAQNNQGEARGGGVPPLAEPKCTGPNPDERKIQMRLKTKSMTLTVALAAVLAFVAARPCAGHVPNPTPIDLGTLPLMNYDCSIASAINASGQIVGYSFNGDSPVELPFMWQNGVMTQLPVPEGFSAAWAMDINASGQVVGFCSVGASWQACIWTPNAQGWGVLVLGTPTYTLRVPGEQDYTISFTGGMATKINSAGQVLVLLAESLIGFCGAIWKDGAWTVLTNVDGIPLELCTLPSKMNENGQVLLETENVDEEWSDLWLWDGGVAAPLAERLNWANLNNAGQVVGSRYNKADGRSENFTYEISSKTLTISPVDDAGYYLVNVNDSGQVLVVYPLQGAGSGVEMTELGITTFQGWSPDSPVPSLGFVGSRVDPVRLNFNVNGEASGFSGADGSAFFASAAAGVVPLNDLVLQSALSVTAMNDSGMVIGSSANHAVLWCADVANLHPIANAGPDQTVSMMPGSATVTLDGSGSWDPDGDALTYAWTENGNLIATGVGPSITLATGTHTITLTVTDPFGATATDAAVVTVDQTYSWSGVLQPIDPPNASGISASVFKAGSTVPVKFKLTGTSAGITTLVATLSYFKVGNGIIGTGIEVVSTAAATAGNRFRYDAASGQYIFNWSTKGLSPGTYRLFINLGDGAVHTVDLSLK